MLPGTVSSLPYFGSPTAPSIPSSLPPLPTPSGASSPTGSGPTFADIMKMFQPTAQPINATQTIGGSATFQKGLDQLAPSTGLRPEIQSAIDLINQRGAELKAKNIADATSLATKRGITGSSTELFGTTQGALAADKATQDSVNTLLLQNAQREQNLQDQRANALFGRANAEGTVGAQLGINQATLSNDQLTKLAALTSDEIASLRNMDASSRQQALELYLGQQGVDISKTNAANAATIARQNSQYGLYGALGSALLPGVLFGGGNNGGALNGGTGLLGKLFGGGGSAAPTAVAASGGIPSVGAGTLLGADGLPVPAAASAAAPTAVSGVASAVPLAALTAGGVLGYQSLSDKGKSIVAPLVNPVKTIKTISGKLGGTISKVFGSGGPHTDTKGSSAWMSALSPEEVATQLGQPGKGVSFDSNQSGSAINNYNGVLQSFTPDQLALRYQSIKPTQLGSPLDKQYAQIYQQGSAQAGRPLSGAEFSSYLAQLS